MDWKGSDGFVCQIDKCKRTVKIRLNVNPVTNNLNSDRT